MTNIISFEFERRVRWENKSGPDCAHYFGWTVDPSDHSVACKACGKQLDPYWCIGEIAHRHVRPQRAVEAAVGRMEAVLPRLEKILREMQSAVTPHRILRLEKMLDEATHALTFFKRRGQKP